jgi:hypothetical protein
VSIIQLQLIFNLIISKPMSPWKVALICLEIPTIKKKSRYKTSWFKTTIHSNKISYKIKNVGLHPINIYISKPIIFEELTCIQYF